MDPQPGQPQLPDEKPSFRMALVYMAGSLVIYVWIMLGKAPDWAVNLFHNMKGILYK